MKILGEIHNIEKSVRKNNSITLGLIILMIVMVIAFAWIVGRLSIFYSDNQIILEADGKVRKVDSRVSNEKALLVECQHHMAMLYGTFYTLDQFNFDRQIEAAYWLGDESIRAAYKRYKAQGWYDRIIQDNIEVIAEVRSVKVDLSQYPYHVIVEGVLIFRKGINTEEFRLVGTCKLEKTSRRFPENPHGLQIINWAPALQEIID